jgi:DNA-binding NarL/FixJ family response regulator
MRTTSSGFLRDELPDVVLLEVTMPGNGIAAASRIAAACPSNRIVMLACGLLREMSKPPAADPLAELSTRERQVRELVGGGLSNQEIGFSASEWRKLESRPMDNHRRCQSRIQRPILHRSVAANQP